MGDENKPSLLFTTRFKEKFHDYFLYFALKNKLEMIPKEQWRIKARYFNVFKYPNDGYYFKYTESLSNDKLREQGNKHWNQISRFKERGDLSKLLENKYYLGIY